MRRLSDAVWAVLEMVPGCPRDRQDQRILTVEVMALARCVRWRRAVVLGPLIAGILAGQQLHAIGGIGDVVHDPMTLAKMSAEWLDGRIKWLMKEYSDEARFLSQAAVAYKSYRMANSIAQRVRYGNVDFLVEMALPKIDFTTSDVSGNTEERTRTQISFVPSARQSEDNLAWIARYGGRKAQDLIAKNSGKTRTIGEQLYRRVLESLKNPECDVTTSTISLETGETLNVRSPEVWVKLAQADATAAWIFSQHRVGLGSRYYDTEEVAARLEKKQRLERSLQTQAAYEHLISLQQRAAASGENLYDSPAYAEALARYYQLAQSDNARPSPANSPEALTARKKLNIIEEDGRAQEEVLAGAKVLMLAQANRTAALQKNMHEIGKNYQSKPVPKDLSIVDFIRQNPTESLAGQMGINLKQLQLLEASYQTQGEILKLLASLQAQMAVKEAQELAKKKVGEVRQAEAEDPSVRAQKSEGARRKAEQAAEAALPALRKGRLTVVGGSKIDPKTGAKTAEHAISFTVGENPTPELNRVRAAALEKIKKGLSRNVDTFRKSLLGGLKSGVTGSQGFLASTLFGFTGSVRMLFGGDFDMKSESEAWRQAGDRLAQQSVVGGADAESLGLTEAELAALKDYDWLRYIDPELWHAYEDGKVVDAKTTADSEPLSEIPEGPVLPPVPTDITPGVVVTPPPAPALATPDRVE